MTIRARLAIRFTLIVALLLAIFAVSLYAFSNVRREKQFQKRLGEKSINLCKLLTEVGLQTDVLKKLVKTTSQLSNQSITIYDKDNKQLFNSPKDSTVITESSFLDKVRAEGPLQFDQGINEVHAQRYQNGQNDFVVIATAYDQDGIERLHNLGLNLEVGFFICVFITMFAGWLFAGQALAPISAVIDQVDKITASNLNLRVNEGNGKDEIAQLAITFNKMLERIQKAFNLEKSFVSNSSHELRTPLTAITAQLEVALMSERTKEEYDEIIRSVLEDIRRVNSLTNGLLELTHAGADITRIKMKNLRVDELIWNTRNDLLKKHPNYNIQIDVEYSDNEDKFILKGNEHLLGSAFKNIMDNACKFSSDKKVQALFKVIDNEIDITFSDTGIGISGEDISKISQPFFRGSNVKTFPGHGLGLSLATRIIQLHSGILSIDSKMNEYTRVNVRFRRPVFN